MRNINHQCHGWNMLMHTHTNSQHPLGRSAAHGYTIQSPVYIRTAEFQVEGVFVIQRVCDPACFNKRLKWLIPFWLAGGQIMFSQSLHDKIIQDNHFFLAVMLMDEAWLRCANWQCSVSLTESKRMEWKLPQNQCLPEKTFKPFVWRWNNNKFKKYASACLLTCR